MQCVGGVSPTECFGVSYGVAQRGRYPFSVRQRWPVATEIVTGADPTTPVTLERPSKTVEMKVRALVVPGLFASLIAWRVREWRFRGRSPSPSAPPVSLR